MSSAQSDKGYLVAVAVVDYQQAADGSNLPLPLQRSGVPADRLGHVSGDSAGCQDVGSSIDG
jgi:hypothetical protein